jgi:hypothetical protein
MPDNLLSSSTFRQKNGIPAKAIFFLCLANYCARKDQGYAVRAFHHAAIPNSHLAFIGSELNELLQFFSSSRTQRLLPPRLLAPFTGWI